MTRAQAILVHPMKKSFNYLGYRKNQKLLFRAWMQQISQQVVLDLKYLTSDDVYDNEWVHLTLHLQEDGVFRLTMANSHIERTER